MDLTDHCLMRLKMFLYISSFASYWAELAFCIVILSLTPTKHLSLQLCKVQCLCFSITFYKYILITVVIITRNTFCGMWYLTHSQVHNEQTVPIIMAGCIMHAWNGHISTSALKSDVTVVLLDPDLFQGAEILAIRP